LLKKGYEVYGLVRRLSAPNLANIAHIADNVTLQDGDLMDQQSLNATIKQAEPDEVYNLAAHSFVGTSFVQPVLTGEITGLGVLRVLEAVRAWGRRNGRPGFPSVEARAQLPPSPPGRPSSGRW
jgi:GDPmannose 4,6-dehydratase